MQSLARACDSIYISGEAIINAIAGSGGAGIGGGMNYSCGLIRIGESWENMSGIVNAQGGLGAGIGSGYGAGGSNIQIYPGANFIAVAGSGTDARPAIDASGGSGSSILHGMLDQAISDSEDLYIKAADKVLMLPRNYRSFACPLQEDSEVFVYSDQNCTSCLGRICPKQLSKIVRTLPVTSAPTPVQFVAPATVNLGPAGAESAVTGYIDYVDLTISGSGPIRDYAEGESPLSAYPDTKTTQILQK